MATAPTLVSNYPSNGDTGIPVGETILLYFSTGVDLETIKSSIVLYGRDFDQTSGPDQSLWIDDDTGDNPYWQSSPGFKGTVPLDFELVYYDTLDADLAEADGGVITSQAGETTSFQAVAHLVKITPKESSLAPDTAYALYINGDNDANDMIGVSSRTVYDVVADSGNTGTDGGFKIFGTYAGSFDDQVNLKITTAGDIGVAKYKWWYTSLGESSATTGRVTSRRFRNLADGLQIRFTGSGFVVNDLYVFNVEATARMTASSSILFTTNDGSWSTAPTSASTPAPSTPPSSVLPSVSDASEILEVLEMTPESGSYNNPNNTRVITIVFSDDVDPDTITDETVKLFRYPVSGYYSDTAAPAELRKELSLDGDTLTIKF
jgi:hypothetical protein